MEEFLKSLPQLAAQKKKENQVYFKKLKKKAPKNLDGLMQDLHDETFEEVDCLSCANCCKTTGPLFTHKDIDRIAKHFRMKPSDFIDQFLRIDEDKDYVLQKVPCHFLGADNYCSIYDVRPKACREYPHTDRRKIYQIGNLTVKNTFICPATFKIVEKMKASIPMN
ncbi:zinc/iron-chelating domain-containing protein [Nonlabens arenilitoris]|uniref:Zinc/iron-chelating domain-containing protein n=1 Tax=Nonlabens arenilitoris TaxID=1217969 RepID=A0A2S7U811_9FLAO|nr:YkgJ family cysteine cluster protein [Nonlabens arenilitoris]PQJ30687.1 zinc/iron-chelating domain-containing protein [Nonlabens arenilitoris]